MTGKLYIVGVGPGHHDHMTFKAKHAIEESDTIVGYETYVNLVQDLIEGKDVYRYAMTQEVERAHQCIDLAKEGKTVSLVSSGDPGIYGMAGLIYEILAQSGWDPKNDLPVEIIPGISALNSCASLIGSPLMTDFAVLSMSDLLVPWDIIVKRVEAAAQGDFVLVIYNPASKKRIHQLQDTRKILLKYRRPDTPVAIIKGAYRESQSIVITDLENLPNYSDKLGMISTVIIGNSSTYTYHDLMINPRGYRSKYHLEEQTNPKLKV
ncbi:MAG: precorrin-3B C(17)-methyltransferase [Nitrosopumilaceae archaeon]|nr:precorrin-3B C(17)-methyltransferase [Nitrosopumilaceae archaeon]NIU00840.1 precorrin-3B C(17)-methyltransferase [Nitrosopumilaceae archaeon]NIU87293.1 precorrin-3B C(17)-methyltransferase [Nitrosopumilaceae archaeon]NIV65821.1 precorrin-3B C(17)-methyltransferase [Nitrosopumilaceae archaeon]NIX61442.1 precorrin-3B C(17)-methyltransferase [Nitrosopumilaceae archaeon]